MSNNNYMGKIDRDRNPKGINYFAEEKHIHDGGDNAGLVDCLKCEKEMLKHLKKSAKPLEEDPALGSAGGMVAPSTVENFIMGLLENRKLRLIEKLELYRNGEKIL